MGKIIASKRILLASSSLSSSCHAISTDIPDPLSLHLRIVHCFLQILRATPRIGTELLYVGSSWMPCLSSSMWRGPLEYITCELVPTSPACLVPLILIVFMMGGWWLYSCCFVGCCIQNLHNIARSFFSIRLVSVYTVHPYSSIDTISACKKLRFILSVRSDFHMTKRLFIAVHAFASHVMMSASVDETLLPRQLNLWTSFRVLPFSVEMSPVWLKHIYSVVCALTWRLMPAADRSRLCSRVSAWAGAFATSAI